MIMVKDLQQIDFPVDITDLQLNYTREELYSTNNKFQYSASKIYYSRQFK